MSSVVSWRWFEVRVLVSCLNRRIYFEDLKGEEARKYFDKFVEEWNAGRLEDMYYDGIPDQMLASSKRTRHVWSFSMDTKEQWQLDTVGDRVASQTNHPKKTPLQAMAGM